MSRKLEANELKEFYPFHLVDDDQLWMMACLAEIVEAAAGEQIFGCGDEDDSEFYLLEGDLELRAGDGVVKKIQSGELVAKHPVARLRPRRYTGVAKTPCVFFTVHRDVLAALHAGGMDAQNNSSQYVVDELPLISSVGEDSMSEINQAILAGVAHDLKINTFVLPNHSRVIDRIVNMIRSDDSSSVAAVAEIAYSDPSMSVKLLKAANSTIYSEAGHCNSVVDSIARLGLNTSKQLMHCFVARDESVFSSSYLSQILEESWIESVRVSMIAAIVANVVPEFDINIARLAGLVHRIGEIGLLKYIAKNPEYFNELSRIELLIDSLGGSVGEIILKQYGLSDELIAVAAESNNWMREGDDKPDYCDLILIAKLHSYIGTPQGRYLPKLNTIPAFKKLAQLNISPEFMIKVMAIVNRRTEWMKERVVAEAV